MNPAVLDTLRRADSRRFDSACTITRPGGEPVFNPVTGEYVSPEPTTVYTGPCLVRPMEQELRAVEFGGASVTLHRYTVKVPANTTVRENDTLEVTASQNDAGLPGVSMLVKDVLLDERQTSRVLTCEDVRT